jgi:Bacterial archaeo-eukaryotic release factor family 10
MAFVNELDGSRLRALAQARDSSRSVLSLYLDLDPSTFATAPARQSEVDSLLDRAHREIEDGERSHGELMALRGALERARETLNVEGSPAWAEGSRAVALFISQPIGLDELLRLDRTLPSDVAIGDTAYIEPLAEAGTRAHICVALVDERIARFMRGSWHGLREGLDVQDDVHGREKVGGWSQARYQRAQHEEVREHYARVAQILERTLLEVPYERLLLGCPEPQWNHIVELLHPEVRARLHEQRLSVQVPEATPAEVERAAAPMLAQERRAHEDDLLGQLREHLARPEDRRAAAGMSDVLEALVERRVQALLYDEGSEGQGVLCPSCGWMGVAGERCPVDGTELLRRERILDDAIHSAVEQDAEVVPLSERPDLGPLGGVAAVLRF